MTGSSQPESPGAGTFPERALIRAAFAFQAVFLLVAGWRNRDLINTDAIAYIRLADYYVSGQTGLMVSGYWGPLLTWIIAVGKACGLGGLAAGRVATGLSAVLFLGAALRAFRVFGLPSHLRLAGLWIAAALSVFWSIRYITPDVLLAALLTLAVADLADDRWWEGRRIALRCGLWWGLAYLAKAAALPLAVAITGSFALLRGWMGGTNDKGHPGAADTFGLGRAFRQAALTFAALALLAGPWITVLTLKYGTPTFSTSGRINHAIAGPPDVERYHPFARTFHTPEPGRVTAWEDPSGMDYADWSPFSSGANFRHQLRLVRDNLVKIFTLEGGLNLRYLRHMRGLAPRDLPALLPGFDLLFLGVLGTLGCLVGLRPLRATLSRECWRWVLIPVVFNAAIYLPMFLFAEESRYFYPNWAFLWIAACGVLGWLVRRFPGHAERLRHWGPRVLIASVGLPALLWWMVALVGVPNASAVVSRDLADRIERAGIAGSLAGGSLLQGGRPGLFTAFLLNRPWHGDEPEATPDRIASCGADLYLILRDDPRDQALASDTRFRSLDDRLFASPEEAASYPLQVFQVLPDRGAASP